MGYLMPGDGGDDKNRGVISGQATVSRVSRSSSMHKFVPWLVAISTIFLWWLVDALKLFPPVALPSPGDVLQQIVMIATKGYSGYTLLDNIGASVGRITVGFVTAVIVGVPIGFWMASNKFIFAALDPLLQFLRPIPPLAYIPVMVVWFGTGELSKFVLIFFCTLPIIIISAMSGVKSVQETRLRVASVFGASSMQKFRYVVLPSALPEIFTGMRVGIGVAWSCLVAAEILAASVGLGWLVQYAGQEVQIGIIFVGIAAIGLLGYLMELAIRLIESMAVPWKGRGTT